MRAGPPLDAVAIPTAVEAFADPRAIRAVWRNGLGGVAFEVGAGNDRCFVKWAPPGSSLDLGAEAARMAWAAPFTPVPTVIASGADAEGAWLATTAIPGENAVTDRWRGQPAVAVRAIGERLRALHEALPVEDCPFRWSVDDRVAHARRRAAAEDHDLEALRNDHGVATVAVALSMIAEPPSPDRIVVCHGDPCAPNTIIDDDGVWSGTVDLGSLGVADRWADIAVATWNTRMNYGPGWEGALLDAYGIELDPVRYAYYRLLWDLA